MNHLTIIHNVTGRQQTATDDGRKIVA